MITDEMVREWEEACKTADTVQMAVIARTALPLLLAERRRWEDAATYLYDQLTDHMAHDGGWTDRQAVDAAIEQLAAMLRIGRFADAHDGTEVR